MNLYSLVAENGMINVSSWPAVQRSIKIKKEMLVISKKNTIPSVYEAPLPSAHYYDYHCKWLIIYPSGIFDSQPPLYNSRHSSSFTQHNYV